MRKFLRLLIIISGIITCASITYATIDPDKIFLHWKMDDNLASTTIIDYKGLRDLVAPVNTNTISKAGKFNLSLNNTQANAFSSAIVINISTSTGMTGTIDLWYNLQKTPTIYNTFFSFHTASKRMEIKFDNAAEHLTMYSDGLGEFHFDTTPIIQTKGQWVHMTIVKNATGWLRYENAVFKSYTAGYNEWFPSWGSRTIIIGSYDDTNADYDIIGLFDQISISNQTWSAEDVLVANSTAYPFTGTIINPCNCPSPISNWYFACNTCPTLPTCDMQGYDLYLQGSGTSELTGDITNVKNVYQMTGCNMVATTGRNFYFMKN